MGSSKSKNKKKKSVSKRSQKSDAHKSDSSEVKVKEVKPVAESPKPSKQPEGEGPCNKEVPCDTSKYYTFQLELLVSFNKCFTGFLAEIPSTSLAPSTHDELCARIKNGDNYKYLMSCPFRDNQMNTCMQDFCCRKTPITVTQQCPLDC